MPSLGRNRHWRKETKMMRDILKDPLASWTNLSLPQPDECSIQQMYFKTSIQSLFENLFAHSMVM